jgi:3-dehydroquinate dehydratase-2
MPTNHKNSNTFMTAILVLHGPNLNLLGTREPDVYGQCTLESINQQLSQQASTANLSISVLQSNAESELINRIHQTANDGTQFLLFNPGAFTHTSVALRDAILGVKLPFIEVHLSNVHARESFRQHSYFSDIALGVICGFGANSYTLAMQAAIHHLHTTTN